MSTTPESKIKKQVKKHLDALGAYYFMPAMGAFGRAGVPDFIGCLNGRFFGIEAKAGGNKATALQLKELQKIHDAGGVAMIINEDNIEFEIERQLLCR